MQWLVSFWVFVMVYEQVGAIASVLIIDFGFVVRLDYRFRIYGLVDVFGLYLLCFCQREEHKPLSLINASRGVLGIIEVVLEGKLPPLAFPSTSADVLTVALYFEVQGVSTNRAKYKGGKC